MFDFRYHALSLAAVLLALAVGVVIGVAIGDSNLVSSAKSGIVHDLSGEVSAAQHQAGVLRVRLGGEEALANDLYPLAVGGLLNGRAVGLVFLGGSSNRINDLVRAAVTQAGGNLLTVIALREPLDLSGLGRAAAGTHYAGLDSEPSSAALPLIQRFGLVVGHQLVGGGPLVGQALLSRARGPLLSAFDGTLGKLDGVVVMRDEPTGMLPEQAQVAAAIESGLIAGVARAGVATVGVELGTSDPSQIPWYQSRGLASVDDLDQTAGQAALIYALSGAHGAYGMKSTADSLLPSAAATGR